MIVLCTWERGRGSHYEMTEGRPEAAVVSCPAQETNTLQLITAHLQNKHPSNIKHNPGAFYRCFQFDQKTISNQIQNNEKQKNNFNI